MIVSAVHLFMFIKKSSRDLDIQISAYENQASIIKNQHSLADAIILLMKMTSASANEKERAKMLANMQLPKSKVEDLPN